MGLCAVCGRPVNVPRAGTDALVVNIEDRWFRPPGGERVLVAGRVALWRILCTLVDMRLATPGSPTPAARLFERGWPGERAMPRSAAGRVHTAVWTLRRLGLRAVVVRSREGYLLDPAVPVVRE